VDSASSFRIVDVGTSQGKKQLLESIEALEKFTRMA
jgi:hypothetical protein